MKMYNDSKFLTKLIKAVNDNQLIIFVGAGVSRLCGLPSWDQAANSLLDECFQKKFLSYADKQRILETNSDAKTKITIGHHILHEKTGNDVLYHEWMKSKFSLDENDSKKLKIANRIIDYIFGMSHIIFSTNVDLILDKRVNDMYRFYKKDNIEGINIQKINEIAPDAQIWHLHGSLESVEDTVFTTMDYLNRYTNDSFRENLHNILKSDYTILFIGYGLSELQLLDFLVNSKDDNSKTKRFYLKPYFGKDKKLYEVEEPYYEDYGIQTIAYNIDKKGYDTLLDVLEYLNNKIKKKSIKQTHEYELVKLALHSPYNDENRKNVEMNFDNLDENTKSDLIKTLSNDNPFLSDWLCFLIKKYKKLFILTGFSDKTTAKIKELKIKNTRYLLNSIVKCRDLFPEDEKIQLMKKTFTIVDKTSGFDDLRDGILSCIFSDYKVMELNEAQQYIKKIENNQKDHPLWLDYANYRSKDQLLNANKPTTLFFLKLAIEYRMKILKRNEHCFSVFTNNLGSCISSKYPLDVFDISFNSIKNHVCPDNSEYSYSGDCFEFYKENNQSLFASQEKDIIRWIIFSLEFMDNESLKNNFFEFIKKKSKFETRLAIYMCNLRFKDLRSCFFGWLRPLNDLKYYSEIYSLFDKNRLYFSESEIKKIEVFIEKSVFDSDDNTNDILCKIDLCSIFTDGGIENKLFLDLKNFLSFGFPKEYLLEAKENPLNRSKLIRIESKNEKMNNELRDKLVSMNTKQFIDFLKNYVDWGIPGSVQIVILSSFKAIYQKLKLDLSSFDLIKDFPDFLVDLYLEEYFVNDKSILSSEKLYFLKQVISQKTDKRILFKILRILNLSYWQNLELNADQNNDIFNFIFSKSTEILNENDWKFEPTDLIEPIGYEFIETGAFNFLSFLIKIVSKDRLEELLQFLDDSLQDSKRCSVTKAAVMFNFVKMWELDSNWILNRLSSLFNNNVNGNNYSYSIFGFCYVIDADLVSTLNEKGILDKLLASKEFDEKAGLFASEMLYEYLLNDSLPSKVVHTVFSSQHAQEAFLYFLQDFDFSAFTGENSKLCDILSMAEECIKEKNSDIVVGLLEICVYFTSVTFDVILKCALAIAKYGFDGYAIMYVLSMFQKQIFTNDWKKEIVSTLVNSLFGFERYFDDILCLFDAVDWTGDEDGFQRIVSKLQVKSHDLAMQVLKEHRNKYVRTIKKI